MADQIRLGRLVSLAASVGFLCRLALCGGDSIPVDHFLELAAVEFGLGTASSLGQVFFEFLQTVLTALGGSCPHFSHRQFSVVVGIVFVAEGFEFVWTGTGVCVH